MKYKLLSKFDGAYSRNISWETKDGAFIINLDEYEPIGTRWIALYVNAENVTYFASFGVEHILKIQKLIRNKKIVTNIYRVQAYETIMWILLFSIYLFYIKR